MRYREIITEKAMSGPFSMTLYHGTTAKFDKFDTAFMSPSGAYGAGFYFSNDIGLGRTYSDGHDPITAVVTLVNPYYVDLDLHYLDSRRSEQGRVFRRKGARERLIEQGYDGVVISQGRYVEVIAYYPEQIVIKKDVDA